MVPGSRAGAEAAGLAGFAGDEDGDCAWAVIAIAGATRPIRKIIVLCFIVLCFIVLCFIVLCFIVLCFIVPYFVGPCSVILCFILPSSMLRERRRARGGRDESVRGRRIKGPTLSQ